jgi:hypothetical protein
MKYLITTNVQPPFYTEWFDPDNHFNAEVGMIVYDLDADQYTTDGVTWKEIEWDHL